MTMGLHEILIVSTFAFGLGILRFGVPILATWGISRLLRRAN
jgi:hypothetical protein